ncbi:papain-like cysteine protease family protein [Microcoleus sp. ARI1-B5]|uniref:papain-like cysteine protease family protein n=1 Tax=unclassified Microcoleus TaxID=2642155 RepID=UPI002FD14738
MAGLSGAGGNWQVIDEIADRDVVQQQDKLSSGPACGEMLLGDRGINGANQSLIAAETGVPVNIEDLAIALNTLDTNSSRFWLGGTMSIPGATNSEIVEVLISTGSWAAILWETLADLGHIVIVDGLDDTGKILIRDPWNATKYKMELEEFLNYWNLQAVYSLIR